MRENSGANMRDHLPDLGRLRDPTNRDPAGAGSNSGTAREGGDQSGDNQDS